MRKDRRIDVDQRLIIFIDKKRIIIETGVHNIAVHCLLIDLVVHNCITATRPWGDVVGVMPLYNIDVFNTIGVQNIMNTTRRFLSPNSSKCTKTCSLIVVNYNL